MRNVVITAVLAASVFVSIFFNNVFNNLNKPIADDGDLFVNVFLVDNNLDKLSKFDFANLFDTRMFYPHKNTLGYSNSQLGPSFLALPFFLLTRNSLISTNLMIIVTLFLSFLAMFFLAYYYTKSLIASILGAVIFNFNPYEMTHFPGYIELITLQWIPLIFLLSEWLFKKVTWGKSIVLAILFFMQLISSTYYFMYLLIIWPIFIFSRVYFGKIKNINFLHPAVMTSTLLFVFAANFYIQPFISVRKDFGVIRSIESNIYHSANFGDFLSKTNTPNEPDEHSLFMGWTVYFLIIISFWLALKGKFSLHDRLTVRMYILFFLLSVIFSFGPYLVIGSSKIPLPYLVLYKIIPFFDGMRVPARFIIIANLSASLLSAFCLSYLLKFSFLKYKLKTRIKVLVLVIISAILLFEYWQKPIPSFYIKPEILSFYSWLDTSDAKVIVELPIANSINNNPRIGRSFVLENRYLLYGIFHHKHIVNGASSIVPNFAYILGDSLTLNFPTPSKIDQLKKIGVNLIVVHLDEYKDIDMGKETINGLERLNLKKVYNSEHIIAFSLNR